MSKSQKLRELQEEINHLKFELEKKDKIIVEFQKRAKPELQDFIKKKGVK